MNSWTFQGAFIDYNGLSYAANGSTPLLTNPTSGNAYVFGAINVAANFLFADTVSDSTTIVNGPTTSNHCWTAVAARPDAVTAKRAAIAGYIGSITTCLKHAIDGYSFWGVTLIARVGENWVDTAFATADASLSVSQLAANA